MKKRYSKSQYNIGNLYSIHTAKLFWQDITEKKKREIQQFSTITLDDGSHH
jgi:hypothetical protein